jgi:hypothetical protein
MKKLIAIGLLLLGTACKTDDSSAAISAAKPIKVLCPDGVTFVRKLSQCPPVVPPPQPTVQCWDGSMVFKIEDCPAQPPPPPPQPTVECWDGSKVFKLEECPPIPPPPPQPTVECWDGTMVFKPEECPNQPPPQPTVRCWDGSLVFKIEECPPIVLPPPPPPPQPTVKCWDGTMVFKIEECPVQPPPPTTEPPPLAGWQQFPLATPHRGLHLTQFARAIEACTPIKPEWGTTLVKDRIYRIIGYGAAVWSDSIQRDHWSVVYPANGTTTEYSTVLTQCLIGVYPTGTNPAIWTQP